MNSMPTHTSAFITQLCNMHPDDAVERFLPEHVCKEVSLVPPSALLDEAALTRLLDYLRAHTCAALRAQDLRWISSLQNLAELLMPLALPGPGKTLDHVRASAQLDVYESMLEYGRLVALEADKAMRAGEPVRPDPLALRRAKRLQAPVLVF